MVLIVEDEAISRRALQQLLKLHGLDARAVGSAEEAIDVVGRSGPPHTALVDIDLPGKSGVDFVREMHRHYPKLRCIYLTANEDAHAERIRSGEADYLMLKPVDLRGLLHLIDDRPAACA
jgi:DNA-binding NtrC family response regulator